MISGNPEEKVACQTPSPGKQPTRIAKWKYDAIRKAILEAVPSTGDGVAFKDLANKVKDHLSPDMRKRVGSIPWYTVTVKLDMEVKGLIERVSGRGLQRIRRRK